MDGVTFPFDVLRRWPDVEAPGLAASDAADRLILEESADARRGCAPGSLVVIGDGYGALTLAAAAERPGDRIRVHQDALTGERALAANAARLGGPGAFDSMGLDAALVRDAEVVLLRLPRALEQLRDVAGLIAAYAAPGVRVYAGGRIKHMATAMNDVLRERFARVDVMHARQKSRVLVARGPHDGADPVVRTQRHGTLTVCAYGGVFAGTSIDIGTRFLLESLPPSLPADDGLVVDLACGTGVVAATLALRHPQSRILATDQSAVAVASAAATARANGVADRVDVVRDDGMAAVARGAASFVALNPPFHVGGAIHEGVAPRLFADAARALRPGGELWTVWNSALGYRPSLERVVGPTRQVARNAKFTVTASTGR